MPIINQTKEKKPRKKYPRKPAIYVPTGGKRGATKYPPEAKRSSKLMVQMASDELEIYTYYANMSHLNLSTVFRLAILRYVDRGSLTAEEFAEITSDKRGFLPRSHRKLIAFTQAQRDKINALMGGHEKLGAKFARFAFEAYMKENPLSVAAGQPEA